MIYILCVIGGVIIGAAIIGAVLVYAVNYAIMKGLGW